MGYMPLQNAVLGALNERPRYPHVVSSEAAERLSSLEWSVVTVARVDRLSTLREPGRLATALSIVIGTRNNPRLACARLEALRQIAVLVWRRGLGVPVDKVTAFTQAGFTLGQYELLVATVTCGRSASAKRLQT
jgi:hypothetical protein